MEIETCVLGEGIGKHIISTQGPQDILPQEKIITTVLKMFQTGYWGSDRIMVIIVQTMMYEKQYAAEVEVNGKAIIKRKGNAYGNLILSDVILGHIFGDNISRHTPGVQ